MLTSATSQALAVGTLVVLSGVEALVGETTQAVRVTAIAYIAGDGVQAAPAPGLYRVELLDAQGDTVVATFKIE